MALDVLKFSYLNAMALQAPLSLPQPDREVHVLHRQQRMSRALSQASSALGQPASEGFDPSAGCRACSSPEGSSAYPVVPFVLARPRQTRSAARHHQSDERGPSRVAFDLSHRIITRSPNHVGGAQSSRTENGACLWSAFHHQPFLALAGSRNRSRLRALPLRCILPVLTVLPRATGSASRIHPTRSG